jgi:pimeloyl-ACP methyl ester carboxylesterase
VPLALLALVAAQITATVNDTITLDTPTGKIAGTLVVPASSKPVPLVVIIAGSGPTNRDGNSPLLPGANNSLKLLAEGLRDRGIATLRYDKRGIAESVKAGVSEAALRFDMFANDAAGWVQKLRPDARFSTVTILGHSEGSLLGMLATSRGQADAFVSIAGAGRPASVLLREQLGKQPLPPELLAFSNRALDALVAGRTVDSVPPALATLFRPSVQPYLISWLPLDPAALAKALTVPVLITQGTTDIQVSVRDAELLAAAQPKAKLVIVNGMNHVLKTPAGTDPASQQASYSDPSLPVARELIEAIATFVQSVPRRTGK